MGMAMEPGCDFETVQDFSQVIAVGMAFDLTGAVPPAPRRRSVVGDHHGFPGKRFCELGKEPFAGFPMQLAIAFRIQSICAVSNLSEIIDDRNQFLQLIVIVAPEIAPQGTTQKSHSVIHPRALFQELHIGSASGTS